MTQIADVENAGAIGKGLYRVGAVAALLVLTLFLIGVIGIITESLQLTPADGWFTQLQNNWLVGIFKLSIGVQSSLHAVNLLDLVIMTLFCTMSLAFYVALKPASKIWSLIAAILPFLGIPLFLITGTMGRSNLLMGGLVVSVVMLRSKVFSKLTAYTGIAASVLLFFLGDIATTIFSTSYVIAAFIVVGYVLWMLWFSLIAQRLFQLGRSSRKKIRIGTENGQAHGSN
jgi:hypothetical protein